MPSKSSHAQIVKDGISATASPNRSVDGPSVDAVLAALSRYAFIVRTEADLQLSIAEALKIARIDFEREVRISERDRLDFLCGRVAIEAKVRNKRSDLIRQLHRYCEHPSLDAIVIASTKTIPDVPILFNGKQIRFVLLRGYL